LCNKELSSLIKVSERSLETRIKAYEYSDEYDVQESNNLNILSLSLVQEVFSELSLRHEWSTDYSSKEIDTLTNTFSDHYINQYNYITLKDKCDLVKPAFYSYARYIFMCDDIDHFTEMYIFSFNEEDFNASSTRPLMLMCKIEKNHSPEKNCSDTVEYASYIKSTYGTYLASHDNPYYSVTSPDEEITEYEDEMLERNGYYDSTPTPDPAPRVVEKPIVQPPRVDCDYSGASYMCKCPSGYYPFAQYSNEVGLKVDEECRKVGAYTDK
jgi:hypothetical protein